MDAIETTALEALKRTLLPPLRFAARDGFSAIMRLQGFSSLVDRALQNGDGQVPESIATALRKLSRDFDDAEAATRQARVRFILDLLGDTSLPSAQKSSQVRTSEFAQTKRKPSRSPPAGGERSKLQTSPPRRQTPPTAPSPQNKLPDPPPVRHQVVSTRGTSDVLSWSVNRVPGIGARRAAQLTERNLSTVGGLLAFLPRTYENRKRCPLAALAAGGHVVVQGEITGSSIVGRGRGMRLELLLEDDTGRVKLVFFHRGITNLQQRFPVGRSIAAQGDVRAYRGQLQLSQPRILQGDDVEQAEGVTPVYPEMRGMASHEFGSACAAAMRLLDVNPPQDLLPLGIRQSAQVLGLHEALRILHTPPANIPADDLAALIERRSPAHHRLAFEELFVLQLAMGQRRLLGKRDHAPPLPGEAPDALAKRLLPFTLTGAQRRCTQEIVADLERPEPMSRLLQGDVGSGKTAVAALACLRTVDGGYQAAVMAPTEILAGQHFATLSRWFTRHQIRAALLTGSVKGKARRLLLAKLNNGEIDVLVGTHALLTDDVTFLRLGLTIIDEQHRFGVAQRAALKAKGPQKQALKLVPHLLVMTATPIPRSLALTYYGDLTISVVDELPPGRSPIVTKVLSHRKTSDAHRAIAEALARDERAYVVYPLIEESEKLDLEDATAGYLELSAVFGEAFGEDTVALLHGRMDSKEKAAVMARFVSGEVRVLVSTTVIEVGVDVKEATCMVIINAERFGLSQLHQLRGRVGRSERKSRCILVLGSTGGKDALARLRVMEKTGDGFRIAEEDLAIRGPGDFLGTRQHGLPTLAFSDLTKHAAFVEKARRSVEALLETDPELASDSHLGLRQLLNERYRDRLELAGAG